MTPDELNIEDVDRAIFKRLNNIVVREGYWIDEVNIATSQYDAAIQVIIDSGKELIYVKGVGTYEGTGKVNENTFVLNRRPLDKSPIGILNDFKFVEKTKKVIVDEVETERKFFDKYRQPSTLYDLTYDIRIVTNSLKYDRIMEKILLKAFGSVKYIKAVDEELNDLDQGFEMLRGQNIDVSTDSYREHGYLYRCENINLEGFELVNDEVPSIETIETDVLPVDAENVNDNNIQLNFENL